MDTTPPVLPDLPPTLPAPVVSSGRLSASWIAALAAVGMLNLLTGFLVTPAGASAQAIGYRIGVLFGGAVFWPLIIVGAFSIGKRFRTPRSRTTILLIVWSLGALGHLGNLGSAPRRPTPHPTPLEAGSAGADPLLQVRLPSPVPAPSAATSSAPLAPISSGMPEYDLSPGSDQRLIQLIEHTQEESYHAVVAAYERTCAARPHDAVLALERVKFVERFAYAEDLTISTATEDNKVATAYLNSHFPEAPGTVLHTLRNTYDSDFETKAQGYAHLITRWNGEDRAQFLLLRATAAETKGASDQAKAFAKESFAAHPTAEAGLLVAKALRADKDTAEALRIVNHPVFASAPPWIKRQKMDLLFDLGQAEGAVALLEELTTAAPYLVNNEETATRLALTGRVEPARAILGRLPLNKYTRERVCRGRFTFELQHGTAAQALTAYRDLRAAGRHVDPVLRDRYSLFRKHPGLPWNLDDAVGVGLLGLLLVAALASPLLLLMPVHYWSLLRARRGRSGGWPGARWGLRTVWIVFGAITAADLVSIWVFQPEVIRGWWGIAVQAVAGGNRSLLSASLLHWIFSCVIAAIFLGRARAWRLLGPGQWSLSKAIGAGLGLAFALRFGLRLYLLFWPGAATGELAAVTPDIHRIMLALFEQSGPFGLLAVVAVLVPVLEEVLFRGLLLQGLARHIPFGWANAAQAAVFAVLHENLRLFPFFFAFGLICGTCAYRSRGLLPSIVLHVANNLIVTLGFLVLQYTAH